MYYTSEFIKLDMHVHTEYSRDSSLSLKSIERFLHKHKNFGLVICDHNEVEGALRLKERYPSRIIIGSEIRTKEGEITGLFLKDKIASGKDINWTIDAILIQGGLVYIPHPCCRLRHSKLNKHGLREALKRADIIEAYNSRNVFSADDDSAYMMSEKYNIIPACGSDAHTRVEIGRSFLVVEKSFELSPDGFLNAIVDAPPICRRSSPLVHIYTKLYKKFT